MHKKAKPDIFVSIGLFGPSINQILAKILLSDAERDSGEPVSRLRMSLSNLKINDGRASRNGTAVFCLLIKPTARKDNSAEVIE